MKPSRSAVFAGSVKYLEGFSSAARSYQILRWIKLRNGTLPQMRAEKPSD
jgi:hypothetical protein